ncbi:MFS transporter [Streptomyces sp. NPDC004111]|uniref:MFS transporter n=1 Tax=Streptomyces sp. NPDC004111 TaxID=3364690 RepID=UPI003681DFD5
MLAVLCASLLVIALDTTILNVALPSLIEDLRPTALQQLWINDIYGLILGGLLITSGAVGDRYGRKRLFLGGFVLFGIASAAAALSTAAWQLIAARVLMGLGGAMVMPSTLSLIRNIFTDAAERTRAIGIWAAVAGIGACAGPLLGGVLVQGFGWSAAFWVNVPVVALTLVAGVRLLPEYRASQRGRLDLFSAALSIAGVVGLAWSIKHVAKGAPTAADVLVLLAALGLLGWFARRQLHQPDPLLDVRLFTHRPFLAAALGTALAMLAIGATLFLVSQWLQFVHGHSPAQAGVRTVPAAVATFVAALSAPRLMHRLGVRRTMVTGLTVLAVAALPLAFASPPVGYAPVALLLVAIGVGDGLVVTTAAAVMVAAVRPERAGQAGGVSETAYEIGAALGVACLGSLHGAVFSHHMTGLPLTGEALRTATESIGGAAEIASRLDADAAAELMAQARLAFDHALNLTTLLTVGLAVAVMLLVLELVPRDFRVDAGD